MYTEYYGLSTQPFRLTPDPYFFFDSTPHKSALAYLRYGLQLGEGFIVVTGAAGTGKTTLSLALLGNISDSKLIIGELVTTQLQGEDLLRSIASTFKLDTHGTKSDLILRLQEFLTARAHAGKKVLLVVDEAHNLPPSSFEELRMLSNFHRGAQALLQCILLGQPPLRDILAQANMEQLQQRVIATHHLLPLSPSETRDYILHRLQQAGWKGDPTFTADAVQHVYQYTRGIPRLINSFCNRILLFGYIEEKHQFEASDVIQVYNEREQEFGHMAATESLKKQHLNEVNTVGIAQEHVALKRAVGADSVFYDVEPEIQNNVSVMTTTKVSEFSAVPASSTVGMQNALNLPLPVDKSLALSKIPTDAAPPYLSLKERFVEALFQLVSVDKDAYTPISPRVSEKSSLILPLTAIAVALVLMSMILSHYYPDSNLVSKFALPSSLKQIVTTPENQKTMIVQTQESPTQVSDLSQKSSVDKHLSKKPSQEQVVGLITNEKNTTSGMPGTSSNTSKSIDSLPTHDKSRLTNNKSEFSALESQSYNNILPKAIDPNHQLDNQVARNRQNHMEQFHATETNSQTKVKDLPVTMGHNKLSIHDAKTNERKSHVGVSDAHSNKPKLATVVAAHGKHSPHVPDVSPKINTALTAPTKTKPVLKPLSLKKRNLPDSQVGVNESRIARVVSLLKQKELLKTQSSKMPRKVELKVKSFPKNNILPSQPRQKTSVGSNSTKLSQPTSLEQNSISSVPDKIIETPKPLSISTEKLTALMNLFRWAYDSGDVDTLEGLFTSDARSDEYENREAITQSYQKLFNITKERRLVLSDLRWSNIGDAVQGDGHFAVSVKEKGRNWTSSYIGKITLRVEKRDGKALITSLNHSYTR